MAAALQIPFGLRLDGRLVEVAQVERGLACNCTCPGCGERLLAKKGEKNVQHFAHLPGSECASGAETALHLAAKQLVADKGWIRLPALPVSVGRSDPQCGNFVAHKVFGHGEVWRFDRVVLEQAVGELRPDAVGYIGDDAHGVEIHVTHEVDGDKQASLARLALPAIEVDLAALVGKVFTFDALEAAVISSEENKRWLFHPRRTEWEAMLLAGFEAWRQGRLAEMARREAQPARTPAPPRSRTDAYQVANLRYRASPVSEKWRRLEQELGIQRKDFPSHLRVNLREGGDIVLADKDLWQGALFSKFVLGAAGESTLGKRMPNARVLSTWLAQRFGVKGDEDAARPAADAYLRYLKSCGFLRWQAGDLFVAHNEVTPPVRQAPAPAPKPAAPLIKATPSLQWREVWPDNERLRHWAGEVSRNGSDFDDDWFVGWLLRLSAPPSSAEVQDAFGQAQGNPAQALDALRGLGVVANTWRYFSYGEPAPWIG